MVRFYAFYRRHCVALLLGLTVAAGCGHQPDTASAKTAPPPVAEKKSPQEQLYDQLHSGTFQLEAGMDSIADALKASKEAKASGEVKQSLADIQNDIDSAGSSLAEEVDDAPDQATVAKDMKSFDAKRVKLCDLINDSLHDLRDARGIVDSLAEDGKDSPLESVGEKIDVAVDDLKGALEALGGKDEEPEDSNAPSDK